MIQNNKKPVKKGTQQLLKLGEINSSHTKAVTEQTYRLKTSPSKKTINMGQQFNENPVLSNSFTISKERSSGYANRFKSPKNSQGKIDTYESDLKMANLQLQMELKESQEMLAQNQQKYQDFEVQYQCMKELTIYQRQTIEQQKHDSFEDNTRFWKTKSDLALKEGDIENLTLQLKNQQKHLDQLQDQVRENSKKNSSSTQTLSTSQDDEIKKLQFVVREYKKELTDIQKKIQNRDYNQVLLQVQEQKEKVMVLQEINELLKEQLKKIVNQNNQNEKSKSPINSHRVSPDRQRSPNDLQSMKTKITQLESNEINLEHLLKEKQREHYLREKTLLEKINKLDNHIDRNENKIELFQQIHQQQDIINVLQGELQRTQIINEKLSLTPTKEILKIKKQLLKAEKDQNPKVKQGNQQDQDQAKMIMSLKNTLRSKNDSISRLKQQINDQQQVDQKIKQISKDQANMISDFKKTIIDQQDEIKKLNQQSNFQQSPSKDSTINLTSLKKTNYFQQEESKKSYQPQNQQQLPQKDLLMLDLKLTSDQWEDHPRKLYQQQNFQQSPSKDSTIKQTVPNKTSSQLQDTKKLHKQQKYFKPSQDNEFLDQKPQFIIGVHTVEPLLDQITTNQQNKSIITIEVSNLKQTIQEQQDEIKSLRQQLIKQDSQNHKKGDQQIEQISQNQLIMIRDLKKSNNDQHEDINRLQRKLNDSEQQSIIDQKDKNQLKVHIDELLIIQEKKDNHCDQRMDITAQIQPQNQESQELELLNQSEQQKLNQIIQDQQIMIDNLNRINKEQSNEIQQLSQQQKLIQLELNTQTQLFDQQNNVQQKDKQSQDYAIKNEVAPNNQTNFSEQLYSSNREQDFKTQFQQTHSQYKLENVQNDDVEMLQKQITDHLIKEKEYKIMGDKYLIVSAEFECLKNSSNDLIVEIEQNELQFKRKLSDQEKQIQQYKSQKEELQQQKLKKVSKPDIPSMERKNSDLLFTSSDEEDQNKLKSDKIYYKKEFEDLLVLSKESEHVHSEQKTELRRQSCEINLLKSQIQKFTEDRAPPKSLFHDMNQQKDFLEQDKSMMSSNQLETLEFESELHQLDLQDTEDEIDMALILRLEKLQTQMMGLNQDLKRF